MSLLSFCRKSPFFRLFIFFAAGLMVAGCVNLQAGLTGVLAIALMALSLLMAVVFSCCGFGFSRILPTVLLCVVLFSEGLIHRNQEVAGQQETLHNFERKGIFKAVVLDAIEIRGTTVRAFARITGELKGDSLTKRNLKAVLYIKRDADSESLLPGSGLIFAGDMRRVWQAGNPDEFNYREYLANRKVYLQVYLDRDDYHLVQADRAARIRIRAANARQALLNRYRELDLKSAEAGVLSALTLGYRNDLDAQTENTFVHAGVMHIMALSGFHVGMLAMLLSIVLQPFRGTSTGKGIRLGLTLSALWLFSVVSGLSASVIRATLMFSLAMPAMLFARKVNVYNILFASTLMMLTARPGILYDTGFQLSFLAVAGISMAQPLLRNAMKSGLFVWYYFRNILVVSFAAQLATLPVTLLNFHQFPVYFWLSNLFVIPVAALVMYSSFLYLALGFFRPLACLTGKAVILSVKGLLLGITWVERLPGSLQEGIGISGCQALIMLSALLFLGLFFMQRKGSLFLVALTAWLAFLLAGIWRNFQQDRQRILSVNNLNSVSCIQMISGQDCLLLVHPDSMVSQAQLKHSFGNYWANHGVYKHVTMFDPYGIGTDRDTAAISPDQSAGFPGLYLRRHIMEDNLFIQFYEFSILVLKNLHDENFSKNEAPDVGLMKKKVLDVDLVLVTDELSPDLERILQHIRFDVLVLDSSVGYYDALKWTELCHNAGVECWNVSEQGALILKSGWKIRRTLI